MTERLTIHRGKHTLTVSPRDGGFDLRATGGNNITAEEYERIAEFVADLPGAEAFLAKLQKRMGR